MAVQDGCRSRCEKQSGSDNHGQAQDERLRLVLRHIGHEREEVTRDGAQQQRQRERNKDSDKSDDGGKRSQFPRIVQRPARHAASLGRIGEHLLRGYHLVRGEAVGNERDSGLKSCRRSSKWQ